MKGVQILLFLAVVALSEASSRTNECIYKSQNSLQCEYDLSSLVLTQAPFYMYPSPPAFYEVNICGPVNHADGQGCVWPTGACRTYNSSVDLGNFSQNFTDLPQGGSGCPGVRLTYSGGATCSPQGRYRTTYIDIYCDDTSTPELIGVEEEDQCVVSFTMYARAACGEPMYTSSASPSMSMTMSPSPSIPLSGSRSPSPSKSVYRPPSATASPSTSMGAYSPACHAFPITEVLPGSPVTLFGDNYYAPLYQDSCQTQSRTMWYSLKPKTYGNITVSSCNSYTNFNASLSVRVGACFDMACYRSTVEVCLPQGSLVTFKGDPNFQYFIAVSGYNGATGNYQLQVSTTGNADPACSRAISLPGPFTSPLRIQGSNRYAAPAVRSSCGVEFNDRAVWYKISPAPGVQMEVSTCSGSTDFDTVLSIIDGSCEEPVCETKNYDDCSENPVASSLRFTPSSEYYYIVVSGYRGAVGNYQLYLRQETSMW